MASDQWSLLLGRYPHKIFYAVGVRIVVGIVTHCMCVIANGCNSKTIDNLANSETYYYSVCTYVHVRLKE